ncbi:MAG: threonine--tRNA ligase [Patescibacteria group bacterium]|nr:threonine--tRNA ligase [Patescibacteria group bacterium]
MSIKKISIIRHSLAHIMALSVQEMYPGVKFGIGPAIEQGFYYDFNFSEIKTKSGTNSSDRRNLLQMKLSPNDLPKIEKKMKELIRKDLKFQKKVISKAEAKKLFKDHPYKLELVNEKLKMKNEKLSVYELGSFIDLCTGPHVKSTKEIPIDGFKLTKIAGAYWRGSEKNPMLTRIYGLAFETKKELKNHLEIQEEAAKRDHRILGQKLELFIFDEEVGAGLPLWLPKGAILRRIIENYLEQELTEAHYQQVVTPHIGRLELWKTSGHWELYRENMYSPLDVEGEKFLIKPMNCPFHVKIYQSKIRSYKDLPLKFAELGTVYRYEKSGVLHGLSRVRGFTQDDAHIWCASEQLSDELKKLLKHGFKILKDFGFKDFDIYLSTRPEKKYAGSLKSWQKATNSLKYVLKNLKLKYLIDSGGGVFYGPKIDIKIKDSLQREWQCTTIQLDFNLPEKFNITFINKKGKKEKPIMIHRALLGSLERFIGVLLEHYGGALPFWLAPEQIWLIPVGSRHRKYAHEIGKMFQVSPKHPGLFGKKAGTTGQAGFRFQVKDEAETVSKKIREGELQKIPYLLVVGEKEMKNRTVRVRERGKGDIGEMDLTKFLEKVKIEREGK